MTSRLALGLLLAAGVSTTAHAGLISGNYTLDNGNAVALQGLEWMPLTYTAGLSRADVEDGFTDRFGTTWGAGEWKYATRVQTETLLGSLWDKRYDGWSSGNGTGVQWFLRNFGALEAWTTLDGTRHDTLTEGNWTNLDGTNFFFGNDGDCSNNNLASCHALVRGADNYAYNINAYDVTLKRVVQGYNGGSGLVGYISDYYGNSAGVRHDNGVTQKSTSNNFYGSLLVRTAGATPPPTVSAPTSLSVVAIGLLSLLLRRRRPSHQ